MDPSQSDIIDQDGLILPMQDVLLAGTAVVDGCSLDVAQGIAQYHAGGGGGVWRWKTFVFEESLRRLLHWHRT